MSSITIPASRVRQGTLVLYAVALKVRQLISKDFYSVETLDPADPSDHGYQRLLNEGRAKRLAEYIIKGQDTQDAFLPTSVFLATAATIPFDEQTNTITFDSNEIGPFSVVDGQHRLEGLKLAAQKDERVLDFEIPVNVAIRLDSLAQMTHFLIVNTTQKSVDKSVEQRIIQRLTQAINVADLPSLPKWISRTVEKGEVDKATKIADYLNQAQDSPWLQKIRMANGTGGVIKQETFVKNIQKYVLTANNPINFEELDKQKKIFLNYWTAIKDHLDEGDSETLYKSIGVDLFCRFSTPFFIRLQGDYRPSNMQKLLGRCFKEVEGEYEGVGHPEWWRTGGQAGRLNSGALGLVTQALTKALHKSSAQSTVEYED